MTPNRGVCLENRRFLFYAVVFCAVSLRIVFQTFIPEIVPFSIVSFRKLFRFPAKPTRFVIARRAHSLRSTRQSLTERFAIPERTMVARNETEPWKEERGRRMKRRIHVFCDRDFFLLRAPVLRHGMPCLKLSDCHVAALLAMTQNWNVFIWKTDVFHFLRLFFARCRFASSFKRSFRKSFRFQTFRSRNCSVFPQNSPDLSLRGGRIFAPDAAIFDETICHPGTNYG